MLSFILVSNWWLVFQVYSWAVADRSRQKGGVFVIRCSRCSFILGDK